ncbi:MAG: hypothetical protein RI883_418 [Bacteroidota bacterium]|jgi:protein PhnA
MSFDKELIARSAGQCEVCTSTDTLSIYVVPPTQGEKLDDCVYICKNCKDQLEGKADIVANHWRCLNDSMWSEVDGVKVIAYRMLNDLKDEVWPMDLLEIIYLDDETLELAKSTMEDEFTIKHFDCNGTQLLAGDTVVLIKDLEVKGANFTAKRGTAVRNIRLVKDNSEHIEGKVNGQGIVILTQYVKK